MKLYTLLFIIIGLGCKEKKEIGHITPFLFSEKLTRGTATLSISNGAADSVYKSFRLIGFHEKLPPVKKHKKTHHAHIISDPGGWTGWYESGKPVILNIDSLSNAGLDSVVNMGVSGENIYQVIRDTLPSRYFIGQEIRCMGRFCTLITTGHDREECDGCQMYFEAKDGDMIALTAMKDGEYNKCFDVMLQLIDVKIDIRNAPPVTKKRRTTYYIPVNSKAL